MNLVTIQCMEHDPSQDFDTLQSAIQQSSVSSGDIEFEDGNFFCRKCTTNVPVVSKNRMSRLRRHCSSDQHKCSAKWTVQMDPTVSIVSLVQRQTLHNFFGGRKPSKRPNSNVTEPYRQDRMQNITQDAHDIASSLRLQACQENSNLIGEFAIGHSTAKRVTLEHRIERLTDMHQESETVCTAVQAATETRSSITAETDFFSGNVITGECIQSLHTSQASSLISEKINNFLQQFGDDVHLHSEVANQLMSMDKTQAMHQHVLFRTSADSVIKDLAKYSPATETENPDALLQLSAVLDHKPFLTTFLEDIIKNSPRARPVWSQTTLTMFTLLLNYGGPAVAELISKNFSGPSLSTIYLKARHGSKRVGHRLEEQCVIDAVGFYQDVMAETDIPHKLSDIPFMLAVDATAVLPIIKVYQNELVGFASHADFPVSTADDIVKIFKSDEAKATQVYALWQHHFLLVCQISFLLRRHLSKESLKLLLENGWKMFEIGDLYTASSLLDWVLMEIPRSGAIITIGLGSNSQGP
jgi:hypothetical protein